MSQNGEKGEISIIKNYMPWAIVVTIFCCLPFGIVSIIKCAKENSLLNSGHYTDAIHASWKAKHWVWLAFYIGILWNFVLGILVPYVSYFSVIDGSVNAFLTDIGLTISPWWVKAPFFILLFGLGIFCAAKLGKSIYAITEGNSFLFASWLKYICWVIYTSIMCGMGHWIVSLYNSNAFPIIFTTWIIIGIFGIISESSINWPDIGDKFHYGKGVPRCYDLAVHYYEKDCNSSWAQSQLGWHYEHGKGVMSDMRKASEYYQHSADSGHVWSQNHLGVLYEEGKGVRQSYDIAAHYYMKAARQGNMYAQWNIGRMYENGTGVPKSLLEAADWYRKAANQGHNDAKKRLKELDAIIQSTQLTKEGE